MFMIIRICLISALVSPHGQLILEGVLTYHSSTCHDASARTENDSYQPVPVPTQQQKMYVHVSIMGV